MISDHTKLMGTIIYLKSWKVPEFYILFSTGKRPLFPPVSSPSSFSAPSFGFNISWPRITCALFLLSYRPRSGGNYSVSPARFFRLRQSEQDFFVLLNNSTPSIPATTYPPIVPSRNTRLLFMISIVWSWISRISSGSIWVRRSRTASILGIFPCMQFFNRFPILSGAEKNCMKTLILQHQKEQCRHDDIKLMGFVLLFLLSDNPLIFSGILYTLFI